MDDNALAALKAAYEAATEGEWEAMHFEASSSVMTDDQSYARQSIVETQYPTDAAFIVAAHEYVPALLAEVERLQAIVDLLSDHTSVVRAGSRVSFRYDDGLKALKAMNALARKLNTDTP